MFEFSLAEEERLIRDTARRFAERDLLPHLRTHEKLRGIRPEVRSRFTAAGLHTAELPQSADGQSVGAFARALVLEELAAVDPGATLALDGIGFAAAPLAEGGLDSLLASLSAREGRGIVVDDVDARFRLEGDRLYGEHAWVPSDTATVAVVFQPARAFVMTDGIELEPLAACGLESAGAARLHLAGAKIAAVIDDPRALARSRARIRMAVAALLVGAARGAYEYARRYATERAAFGRPIAHHQALAFLIVDVATAVEAARLATWRAAAAVDAGADGEWEAASALAEAAEQALFVGPNAVQILGGHGFMKDHPVEKWMRDIRSAASLFGGRDEAEITLAAAAPERDTGLL